MTLPKMDSVLGLSYLPFLKKTSFYIEGPYRGYTFALEQSWERALVPTGYKASPLLFQGTVHPHTVGTLYSIGVFLDGRFQLSYCILPKGIVTFGVKHVS